MKEEPRASALIREHGPLIARVCMALLGDAEAVESALERVAREVEGATFEEGRSPLARLLGIARGACANQLSKVPIRTTASWGGGDAKPATHRDHGPAPVLARAALGRLKPTEREAVVLHLVGGLGAEDVAEACGIDVGTARQRIARGVGQLVQQEKHR